MMKKSELQNEEECDEIFGATTYTREWAKFSTKDSLNEELNEANPKVVLIGYEINVEEQRCGGKRKRQPELPKDLEECHGKVWRWHRTFRYGHSSYHHILILSFLLPPHTVIPSLIHQNTFWCILVIRKWKELEEWVNT